MARSPLRSGVLRAIVMSGRGPVVRPEGRTPRRRSRKNSAGEGRGVLALGLLPPLPGLPEAGGFAVAPPPGFLGVLASSGFLGVLASSGGTGGGSGARQTYRAWRSEFRNAPGSMATIAP